MAELLNQKSQIYTNITNNKHWYVYIVRCSDSSLYCGITTDLSRRVEEHNTSKKGAKYTRSRRPVRLEWSTISSCKSSASKLEYKIKKLTKSDKENLIKRNIDIANFDAAGSS
jgi:putative endonuclease